MVADAVEGFAAQVQRRQRDIGAPHRMVVATLDVGRQGVLAGVAAGTVTAVVAEGDRLRQSDVEAERSGDAGGNLGDLEGVGQPRALMIVREHEDLGLAGEPAERAGMQDAIAISLEARAPRVRSLVDRPRTGTGGSSCRRRKYRVFGVLAPLAGHEFSGARTSEGIGMGE